MRFRTLVSTALWAAKTKPTTSDKSRPYHKKRAGQSNLDWWTNCAYWAVYPDGPTKLRPTYAGHKKYVTAWLQMRDMIRAFRGLLRSRRFVGK